MTRKPPRAALTDEQRAERRRQEQESHRARRLPAALKRGWQRWLSVRARVGLRRYKKLLSGRQRRCAMTAGVGRR